MVEHNDKEYSLEEALELFLSERRESDNGDWSKPTEDDINLLYGIVYELIEQKFEKDCDGDLPLRFHVEDRTRYQSLMYLNIPHTPMRGGARKRMLAAEMYSMLVHHYSGRLDAELRCMRHDYEDNA